MNIKPLELTTTELLSLGKHKEEQDADMKVVTCLKKNKVKTGDSQRVEESEEDHVRRIACLELAKRPMGILKFSFLQWPKESSLYFYKKLLRARLDDLLAMDFLPIENRRLAAKSIRIAYTHREIGLLQQNELSNARYEQRGWPCKQSENAELEAKILELSSAVNKSASDRKKEALLLPGIMGQIIVSEQPNTRQRIQHALNKKALEGFLLLGRSDLE